MAKFCQNCGAELHEDQDVCLKCGKALNNSSKPINSDPNAKSKMVAGLLGIFLGTLGIHNFYLGYTGKAVAQLLLTIVGWIIIVGPAISGIWAFIEAIMILIGNISVDGNGKPLKD